MQKFAIIVVGGLWLPTWILIIVRWHPIAAHCHLGHPFDPKHTKLFDSENLAPFEHAD
jgi:hypothetical protein